MQRKGRNYGAEYKAYHSSPKAIKERAQRNAARREMMKAGKVRKGDGKDVGHVRAISRGGKNGKENLVVQSKGANRSFRRGAASQMISETSKREKRK